MWRRGDRDEEGRRRSCEAVVLCTASPITADLKIEAWKHVAVIK